MKKRKVHHWWRLEWEYVNWGKRYPRRESVWKVRTDHKTLMFDLGVRSLDIWVLR